MEIKIDIYYVILSLFIGLMFIYATCPKPNIVLKESKELENFENIKKYKFNIV